MPHPKKRYAVHPGYVDSANDGDTHFIGFRQLCSLYGIDPAECINMRADMAYHGLSRNDIHSLIALYPRRDGNYKIPERPKRKVALVSALVYDLRNAESKLMQMRIELSDGHGFQLDLNEGDEASHIAFKLKAVIDWLEERAKE